MPCTDSFTSLQCLQAPWFRVLCAILRSWRRLQISLTRWEYLPPSCTKSRRAVLCVHAPPACVHMASIWRCLLAYYFPVYTYFKNNLWCLNICWSLLIIYLTRTYRYNFISKWFTLNGNDRKRKWYQLQRRWHLPSPAPPKIQTKQDKQTSKSVSSGHKLQTTGLICYLLIPEEHPLWSLSGSLVRR